MLKKVPIKIIPQTTAKPKYINIFEFNKEKLSGTSLTIDFNFILNLLSILGKYTQEVKFASNIYKNLLKNCSTKYLYKSIFLT